MQRTRQGKLGWCAAAVGGLMLAGCCDTILFYKVGAARGWGTEWKLPTQPFRTGERFRLYVDSPHDCYVYVLNKGTSGFYNVLVPNPEFHQAQNFIPAKRHLEIPSQVPGSEDVLGRGFAFDSRTGSEELVIVCSKTAVQDLERLYASPDRSIATVDRILNDIELRGGGKTYYDRDVDRAKKMTKLRLTSYKGCRVIVHRVTLRHEAGLPKPPAHPGGPTPGAPDLTPPGGRP